MLPCGACAATGGSSTTRARCSTARAAGAAIRLGDPMRVHVAQRSTRRVGRRRPRAGVALLSGDGEGEEEGRHRATSPRTATPRTATTCSSGSSAASCSTGTEVKSLRGGSAQLKDGFATIRGGELWLRNVHIPPYAPASRENHEPERERKLLLHRREIERLAARVAERGLTLVPTRIYFSGPRAKVEIALARGKDVHDKRETLRRRDSQREIERGLRDARGARGSRGAGRSRACRARAQRSARCRPRRREARLRGETR